jgi:hypothetical protein
MDRSRIVHPFIYLGIGKRGREKAKKPKESLEISNIHTVPLTRRSFDSSIATGGPVEFRTIIRIQYIYQYITVSLSTLMYWVGSARPLLWLILFLKLYPIHHDSSRTLHSIARVSQKFPSWFEELWKLSQGPKLFFVMGERRKREGEGKRKNFRGKYGEVMTQKQGKRNGGIDEIKSY